MSSVLHDANPNEDLNSHVLRFTIGAAGIEGAYESGPITRDVYVLPPLQLGARMGMIEKLLKLPYGLVDDGCQWQIEVEKWLLQDYHLKCMQVISKLFAMRGTRGLTLIVAKVKEDLFMAGNRTDARIFMKSLRTKYSV